MTNNGDDDDVGYRRPPRSTRFPKGKSGNPRGRPRGSRKEAPYEAVLGQIVTILENGVEKKVSAAKAFLMHLTRQAFEDDKSACRLLSEAALIVRSDPPLFDNDAPSDIIRQIVSIGPEMAMPLLGMAATRDRRKPSAYLLLEPWIVEAALARLGEKRLTPEQQAAVVNATRTPHKVKWPAHLSQTSGACRLQCNGARRIAGSGVDENSPKTIG